MQRTTTRPALRVVRTTAVPTPRADPQDRSRQEAETLADRLLDGATGLPRTAVLAHLLTGARRSRVGLVSVRLRRIDLLAREHGLAAATRLHRGAAEALSALAPCGGGLDGGVFVEDLGSFVLARATAPGTSDRDVRERLRRVAGAAVRGVRSAEHRAGTRSEDAPAVGAAEGPAGPALLAQVREIARPTTVPGGDLHVEPVLSLRSGRVRALHLRAGADRRTRALSGSDLVHVLPRLGAAVRGWRPEVRRAVGVLWLDVEPAALHEEQAVAALASAAGAGAAAGADGAPLLGVRLRACPDLGAPVLRSVVTDLADRGVRWAMSGLADGAPDPDRLDTRLFHDLVVDPALSAATAVPSGPGEVRADPRAAALVALARYRSVLSTVDGVDGLGRFVVAARTGAWYVEGTLFGPPVPLARADRAVRPGQDVRPAAARAALREGAARVPRPSVPEGGADDPGLVAQVRDWLDAGCTPSRVRVLLNAERRFGRWSVEDAHGLVARVAGA